MSSITQSEITTGLRGLGLGEGDIVLLHSAMSSLGDVEGGAEAVVAAFRSVLGDAGTLVVPTFGAFGAIAEAVKAHPDTVHSTHPRGSVAALGADAEALCRDHWKPPLVHGDDTPYTRIAERGGYVCLMGVDQDRNTTLHTPEELLRAPYLKPTREFTFDTPEGPVTKHWEHFPGPHRNFIGLDPLLRGSGKMRVATIGSSVVRLIRSQDLIDIALEAGREDMGFVLCDNPNCADCVAQWADVRRARLGQEFFTTVASAALAGRYVPEMIENCHAAGIDHIELDIVQGKPVHMLGAERLVRVIDELRGEGLAIAGLRLAVASAKAFATLADVAAATGVDRIVLPLSHNAEAFAQEASEAGIGVSFANVHLDSATATTVLTDLRGAGFDVGFTFSAAGFVRCGEKPFLGSYRQKLRRWIDQLDVEDVTFDGTPQPLACGNAEVKELISILRCRSFDGRMLLGAGNRPVGTLLDATTRFIELLDAM